jgi:hypothetical protein
MFTEYIEICNNAESDRTFSPQKVALLRATLHGGPKWVLAQIV